MTIAPTRRAVLRLFGSTGLGVLVGTGAACRPAVRDESTGRSGARNGPRMRKGEVAIGLFVRADGVSIPQGVRVATTSGFEVPGLGAAVYVVDATAAADVVTNPSRSAFRSADGRVFRLRNAVLRPEMFGARGDGSGNDQPAFQAMLDHAAATGTTRVRLAPRTYALWCPLRTTPDTGLAADGVPLVIRSAMSIEGIKGRTVLAFRSPSGLDRTHYQVVNDQVWRGGGMYLVGNTDAATQLKIQHFEMRGVKLDGGIVPSRRRVECTIANHGDGWDVSDKGFRIQDTRVGHILLEDVEITGFRGELAYGGGTGSILSVTTHRCWFHGTDANAYNFDCGQPIVDVESRWGDAFQPIEGHGGPGSRFERTIWYDCTSGGSLWGGRIGAVDAHGRLLSGTNYAESARDDPGRIPWIVLDDVQVLNCGADNTPLLLANWIKGTIRTVDSNVYLTPSQTGRLTTMALVIHAVADRRSVDSAVGLSGTSSPHQTGAGGRPVMPPDNVRVAVSMEQTAYARARGLGFRLPVQVDGFFGDNVGVRVLCGRSAIYPKSIGSAPSLPLIEDTGLEVTGGDLAYSIYRLTDAVTPNDIRFTSTHVLYVGDGRQGEVYRIRPAVDGFADGQIVVVKSGIDSPGGLVIENGSVSHLSVNRIAINKNAIVSLMFSKKNAKWKIVG